LGTQDVQQVRRGLAALRTPTGRPMAPATIAWILATLRTALAAVRERLIGVNPAAAVRAPRPTGCHAVVWTGKREQDLGEQTLTVSAGIGPRASTLSARNFVIAGTIFSSSCPYPSSPFSPARGLIPQTPIRGSGMPDRCRALAQLGGPACVTALAATPPHGSAR
jgi:hypothetical protein